MRDETELAETILKQLTLEEKSAMVRGCTSMSAGAVPRLGIPAVNMCDGPHGPRFEDGRKATALPCGMNLAASFDPAAAEEYGALIARECLANGSQMSLGPGVNLMRTPMNGRNFEYYGEDPVLAGETAAGYIRGCQKNRVATSLKHFALNNQEICRTTASSNCDETTLCDLYLRAFRIAIAGGHPWTVMCSYNKVNGRYASENPFLLTKVLRDMLHYDGTVVSDWGAVHSIAPCANAGLDLEMGSAHFTEIRQAVEKGEIPEARLNEMVRRILALLIRTGRIPSGEFTPGKAECNTPRHRETAKRLAQNGMVLLRNENHLLPLKKETLKTILVTGPGADMTHCLGGLEDCGGSAAVHPEYEITPLQGLREYLKDDVRILYAPGVRYEEQNIMPDPWFSQDGQPGMEVEFFDDDPEKGGRKIAVRRLSHSGLHWGTFAAAGRDNSDPLNPVLFHFRLRTVITPEKDGDFVLSYNAQRISAELFLNGRKVLKNQPGVVYPPHGGVTVRGKKGEPVLLEIRGRRLSADYTSLTLLCTSDPEAEMARAAALAQQADAVLYFGGRTHRDDREAIGWGDVPHADISSWELPAHQNEYLIRLCKANPKVIGCFVSGSPFDVTPWIHAMSAMLQTFYCGQEAGRAVAEVLFGDAAPGGRLPFTWGAKLTDYPCHADGSYPGVRGEADPHTNYAEKQMIGYRGFEKRGIKPVFPFGFGLTYGKAPLLRLDKVTLLSPGRVQLTVLAENRGDLPVKAVPQLYLAPAVESPDRPKKELAAFASRVIAPHSAKIIRLTLEQDRFLRYQPAKQDFSAKEEHCILLLADDAGHVLDQREIAPFAKGAAGKRKNRC